MGDLHIKWAVSLVLDPFCSVYVQKVIYTKIFQVCTMYVDTYPRNPFKFLHKANLNAYLFIKLCKKHSKKHSLVRRKLPKQRYMNIEHAK